MFALIVLLISHVSGVHVDYSLIVQCGVQIDVGNTVFDGLYITSSDVNSKHTFHSTSGNVLKYDGETWVINAAGGDTLVGAFSSVDAEYPPNHGTWAHMSGGTRKARYSDVSLYEHCSQIEPLSEASVGAVVVECGVTIEGVNNGIDGYYTIAGMENGKQYFVKDSTASLKWDGETWSVQNSDGSHFTGMFAPDENVFPPNSQFWFFFPSDGSRAQAHLNVQVSDSCGTWLPPTQSLAMTTESLDPSSLFVNTFAVVGLLFLGNRAYVLCKKSTTYAPL